MGNVIKPHLVNLGLPDMAVQWLSDLWDVIQTFDDLVDGDIVGQHELHSLIMLTLFKMPSNPFFLENSYRLLPALQLAYMKWRASDDLERVGLVDARTFVWRASYYDVVLAVAVICFGNDIAVSKATQIMTIYGESFEDYVREFDNA